MLKIIKIGTNYDVEISGFNDMDYGMHGETVATENISFQTLGVFLVNFFTVPVCFIKYF